LATPYVNAVGYSYVNPTTLGGGRFVASGDKWNDGGGAAVTLTFSFPTGTAYHASNYSSTNEWSIWFWLGSSERAAVQTALSTLSHFVNVTFVETSDTSTNVGELRFAFSNTLTDDEAAHAYYPDTHPSRPQALLRRAQCYRRFKGQLPLLDHELHGVALVR
jgi:serralysin